MAARATADVQLDAQAAATLWAFCKDEGMGLSEALSYIVNDWVALKLAAYFGISAERVRHIGSDAPYRIRRKDMNNGTGKKLAEAAATLGRDLGDVGRDERAINGYYLALVKRHEVRRLVVGHRDRRPSLEEAAVIAELVGVPEGSEPLASRAWIACQDMPSLRVETVEFRWQES